jgi:Domain of unknown function (DUF6431)
MLVVATHTERVARMLATGVGPALPAQSRCPACDGSLGRWPGYARLVRHRHRTTRLWVQRCVCRSCGRTHALLPSFLLAYRRDVVATIGAALLGAARGVGHRPLADSAGLPATTVRGWLRRARCALSARAALVAFLCQLSDERAGARARGDPRGWLLDVIADVHQAAHARLPPVDCCAFNVASMITNGSLLSRGYRCPSPAREPSAPPNRCRQLR